MKKTGNYISRIKRRIISTLYSTISRILTIFHLRFANTPQVVQKIWGLNRATDAFLSNPSFKKMLDDLMPEFSPSNIVDEPITPITVVIPAHPKDFGLLQTVVDGISNNSINPIREIIVICPTINYPDLISRYPIKILTDADVMTSEMRNYLSKEFQNINFGWIKQQVIKISTVLLEAKTQFSLILDADTVLLKPRLFVGNKRQELNFSYEYHTPYMRHVRKFDPDLSETGLSYVTHHQIWDKTIVSEIWGGEKLQKWIELRDKSIQSCLSEYQTYGQVLYIKHPDKLFFSRWGNQAYSKLSQKALSEFDLEVLRKKFPEALSVSIHSYS